MAVWLLLLMGQPAEAQDVPGRYVWPLHGYTNISAGFGDYRTRHYHGGIDISTGGQEGLEVHAADAGWVLRVSTSYWGYGRAVYVQMADGGVAVYGHLSEFASKIQSYVEEEQYGSQRYQQNLLPAPHQIPISRGEIIGKSGQSGSGPPHLHFEIRTNGNRPTNPLDHSFDKPDAIRPSIRSLTVVPLQPSDLRTDPSTVDGKLLPVTYDVNGGTLAGAPQVTGAVGLAVLASDHIDGPNWTVSPYRVRLEVNGVLIGELTYDSIDYDYTRQIDLERRYDPDGGLAPRPINLFRYSRNRLWQYADFVNDGWLSKESGLHSGANDVKITVADIGGNASTLSFSLRLADKPSAAILRKAASSIDTRWSWNGLVVTVAGESKKEPYVALDPEGERQLDHWVRAGNGWQAWLPALTGVDSLWVRGDAKNDRAVQPLAWMALRADDGGRLASSDGLAMISFAPEDLYTSTYLSLVARTAPATAAKPLSGLYVFAPQELPLARDVRLGIALPAGATPLAKLGIYSLHGNNWWFEGNEPEDDWPAIGAMIKGPGKFAILADQTKPTIANVTPGKAQKITERRPQIRFEVTDDLSGIGSDKDLQLHIDGQWVPVELDLDINLAKARPRWDLAPGEHTVEILARDRAGNEETFTRVIRVSR
jgi:hypothetical protein